MKNLSYLCCFSSLIFFTWGCKKSSNSVDLPPIPASPITIHSNQRVVSLQMDQENYDSWIKNNEFSGDYLDFYTFNEGGNKRIRKTLVKNLYTMFKDEFDFILFVLNESKSPNEISAEYISVSNNVEGIGKAKFDYSSQYGSAGKLKGVIQFNALTQEIFDQCFLHELMHNWGNYLLETGFEDQGHWGFIGGSNNGQLGGFKQSSLEELGHNRYKVASFGFDANNGNNVPYSELELYLMGMIPLNAVNPFDVFSFDEVNLEEFLKQTVAQHTFIPNSFNTFQASIRTKYDQNKLLETAKGPRIPSSATSQKHFRVLTVVLTPKPLTDLQWNTVDKIAEKLEFNGSDNAHNSYNFWEATRGNGTIQTGDLKSLLLTQ